VAAAVAGATAIAAISFAGFCARMERRAAIIVQPVATPSSTTMTVLPVGLMGGLTGV
jgi:hypothetical protein